MKKLQMLQQGAGNCCSEIRAKPGIFGKRKRAGSYVDMHGNHLQYLGEVWRK
jgi:hypothetical protein